MADDDEIDILGDFTSTFEGENLLDSETASLVSENSDLLKCDYTIHPQWLLDKPSANPANWYNDFAATTPDTTDLDPMGQISENSITDESGWTEKEKNLLQKGLEIFGKSSIRLAQFVGSKTAAEVRYYLKNFFNENHEFAGGSVDHSVLSLGVLDDSQIPASIEEVIAVVSTGFPTVSPQKKPRSQSSPKKNKPKRRRTLSDKLQSPKKSPIMVKLDFQQEDKHENLKMIFTGIGVGVALSEGEEILKINKEEGEDSDVDIEDFEETKPKPKVERAESPKEKEEAPQQHQQIDVEIMKQLDSMDEPKEEVVLDMEAITDLEKIVHFDFFDGRPVKTPERYMKIRNHIINHWIKSKPNYVYKTLMRHGLKKCGDVTCISRIHHFLEQIGAINFGCEQTNYERPLGKMLQSGETMKGRKAEKQVTVRDLSELGPRQRIKKKKFHNDGEGGLTMVHDDAGQVIDTTVVDKEPQKQRSYVKKPSIRLIYCRPFTSDNPQEYSVKLSLSSLIQMDFHSHSYLTEVMGLIGGHWDIQEKILTIKCYESCKNLASSTTHCDMCPISQARAAENIHDMGFEILGWFHSHPTFAPEPSQQDLETQLYVQKWIGHGKPCLGVILSPFSTNAALISSPFRIWMVDKKPNFEDQLVPFRFKIDVIEDNFDLFEFLDAMRQIMFLDDDSLRHKRISYWQPYFQDSNISHSDKFISSVNMHLAKYASFSQSQHDEIIQGIKDLLKLDS